MKGGSRAVLAAIGIVIAGCGSSPTSVSFPKHSPTSSATASASAAAPSASTGQASPAPVATAAQPAVMRCKVPVVLDSEAGWVTFPGGTYQRDARADHLPPGPTFPLSKAYDKVYERWVPVGRDLISPDGQHYAYADATGSRVHVVDLGTGADHSFDPGAPPPNSIWVAVDYEAEGVYLEAQPNGPAGTAGLWLLTPSSGAVKQIAGTASWQYISGGRAWATSDALTGHGPGPGSRLLGMDLHSGAIVSWYKRTDVEFTVAGADGGGHPILQVTKANAPALIVVTAQNNGFVLPVAPGSGVPSLSNIIHPVTDSHGMWLGDTGGSLSLYAPATGIKKLAQVGSGDVGLAGGCH